MPLAENISERLSYKFYSSGDIDPNTEADRSTDPGAASAQQLRFVSHNLSLTKDTYQSNEKRTDRQISDFRHGIRRAPATINGLLSPKTYGDFFQAVCRGTWAAAVTGNQSDFTSVSADNATSKFTFAGGNPVTKGLRVGMPVVFSGLADADNNKQFVILSFGGASNREMTVYPAPDTMTADTSFTVAQAGKSLIIPASSHVSRKVAFESYQEDLDVAELFTEGRLGGFNLGLPATGNSTVDFNFLGRNRVVLDGSFAPYFSSPTAQTTTGLCQAVNGLLRVNGTTLGVVTSLNIGCNLSPQSPAVIGQNVTPEIFLGSAQISGSFSAFFENGDLIGNFDDEDEIQILAYLKTSNAADPEAITVLLPRVKLGGSNKSDDASGGKIIEFPFTALRYVGAEAGVESTSIQICDSEIA